MKIWAPKRGKDVKVPNSKNAFVHFCIHAGGRVVFDAIEDNWNLRMEDTKASRMTLSRFGNARHTL